MQLFSSKFDFFEDQRLIHVEWSGSFSTHGVEKAILGLKLHPQFDPSFRRLYDLRGLHDMPEVSPTLKPILEVILASDPVVARRALVARDDVAEKCRPFCELAPPEMHQTFTDSEAAMAWLLAN